MSELRAALPPLEGDPAAEPLSPVGWILRQCRQGRGLSQLGLALEAGVSARHLSFVETGRAEPSRELLLRLSAVLGMTARDRNALLAAAGYQPIHRETTWGSPESAELVAAVKLLLRQSEPFPAAALDRDHQIVLANRGFATFLGALTGQRVEPYAVLPAPRLDVLDMVFDPALGVRAALLNWEEVARWVLYNARAEMAGGRDARAMARFDRLLAFPGAKELMRHPKAPPQQLLLPMQISVGGQVLRAFSTITQLGSALDVTASELRIETWHPADSSTEAVLRALA